jgi:hypothetical protein
MIKELYRIYPIQGFTWEKRGYGIDYVHSIYAKFSNEHNLNINQTVHAWIFNDDK